MKKLIKILLLLILSLGMLSCEKFEQKQQERAIAALKEALYKDYGEEFRVVNIRKSNVNGEISYIMTIMPAWIDGFDDYYMAHGYVFPNNRFSVGDTYGKVVFLESGNKFYGPKIKEIFGPNYISAVNYDGGIDYIDWEKEMEMQQKDFQESPDGNFYPIRGGIYIFDRVRNDDDREGIREKIYAFVQYLKSVKNFEYTALWMVVLDERVLSDEFIANEEDQEKLLTLYEEKGKAYMEAMKQIAFNNPDNFDSDPEILKKLDKLYHEKGEEYLKEREKIMNKYTESYNNTSEENKQKAIKRIGKGHVRELTFHNILLIAPLFSLKHVKASRIGDTIRMTNYEKIEEVNFREEIYYRGDINESNNR